MRLILLARFVNWVLAKRIKRAPDHRIGAVDDWYMLRGYIIPRNPFFNIYLHRFLQSDDDRALHDHPWWSLSVLLDGSMMEITEFDPEKLDYRAESQFKIFQGRRLMVGDVVIRTADFAHRLELRDGGMATTLFITGPRVREWGFHCPQGWRHWREFTAKDDSGQVGRGCE